MPMVAFGSRKYSSKLMQDYRNGNRLESKMPKDKGPKRVPWIDRVATPQNNLFLQLTTLSLVSAIGNSLAEYTAAATNGVVGMALVCLTLGMICRQVGLLSHNPLQKSGIFAFMMFTTVMGMNASLANLSPMELLHNIGPIILLLVLGGIGLLVAGVVVGKVFKLDVGLSIAVAFGAFTGYPINYQIALEALQSTTDDPEERSYLEEHILTQVSLGSIVSVTVTSVIAAGVVIALL